VKSTDAISEQLFDFIARLKQFLSLPENWDASGANRVSPTSVRLASSLIIRIDSQLGLSPYFVSPTRDGGVLIEYRNGDLHIEIWMESEDFAEMLITRNDEVLFEETISRVEVLKRFTELSR